MDTNKHGCRKETIYKESMKTRRKGETEIEQEGTEGEAKYAEKKGQTDIN